MEREDVKKGDLVWRQLPDKSWSSFVWIGGRYEVVFNVFELPPKLIVLSPPQVHDEASTSDHPKTLRPPKDTQASLHYSLYSLLTTLLIYSPLTLLLNIQQTRTYDTHAHTIISLTTTYYY